LLVTAQLQASIACIYRKSRHSHAFRFIPFLRRRPLIQSEATHKYSQTNSFSGIDFAWVRVPVLPFGKSRCVIGVDRWESMRLHHFIGLYVDISSPASACTILLCVCVNVCVFVVLRVSGADLYRGAGDSNLCLCLRSQGLNTCVLTALQKRPVIERWLAFMTHQCSE